jgi:hypothetical protein
MIRAREWCIQQQPEGGYLTTQVLSRTRNAVRFTGVVKSETIDRKCRGNIHYTFTPEDYHLYTDSFPKLKPELLALQIKKRFTDLGIAMDTTSLIHKSCAVAGKGNIVNSIFIHEEDLNKNLPQISSLTGVKTCTVFPAAAAIAGLLQSLTEKAVLIFLIGIRFSQVLVVKNGIPIYNQSLAQTGPGQVEEALIPNAVDFARVTLRKDHNIEDFNILCLGVRRDSINLKNLGIDEWQPDFSKVIQTPNQEAVLHYPHLFGVYFADPAYNFIPQEFRKIWQLQSVSKIVATCAGVAAAALLAGWLYYQPILKEQENSYRSTTADLNQQRERINERMPQTTMLNNFERLVNIRTKALEEYRLDLLAKQLSDALPSMVQVTELKMQRQVPAEEIALDLPPEPVPGTGPENMGAELGAEQLSIPEKIQGKAFLLSLTCSSQGSYAEVTTRFEKTASSLNESFGVGELTWNYREAEQTGFLHCSLFPQPVRVTP